MVRSDRRDLDLHLVKSDGSGGGRYNYQRAGFFLAVCVCRPPFFRHFLSHGDRMPCRATCHSRPSRTLAHVSNTRALWNTAQVWDRDAEKTAQMWIGSAGGNVQGHARAHIKGPDGFKLWTHKHAPMSHRRLDCERKKKKEEENLSVGRCRRELRLEQEIEIH